MNWLWFWAGLCIGWLLGWILSKILDPDHVHDWKVMGAYAKPDGNYYVARQCMICWLYQEEPQ